MLRAYTEVERKTQKDFTDELVDRNDLLNKKIEKL